ncbi:MAG TPA: hypothetical protein VN368_00995 [Candidatus Methylomirabilis sp.]|nr:hypothetical protein [Candidatus Methylomirabilis sp.]
MFDPFSQLPTQQPAQQPETIEKIVYVPVPTNTILGIDEKYILGAIIGVILFNFIFMEIE